MKYILIPMALFLSACEVPQSLIDLEVAKALESKDSALCSGLKGPVDDLAGAILSNQEKTPGEVISKGTVVIRGYDEGCK